MPRGGKRPGAGAPRGNYNGLKHGRYSPRILAAYTWLLANPEFQAISTVLAARVARRSPYAASTRARMLRQLDEYARVRATMRRRSANLQRRPRPPSHLP